MFFDFKILIIYFKEYIINIKNSLNLYLTFLKSLILVDDFQSPQKVFFFHSTLQYTAKFDLMYKNSICYYSYQIQPRESNHDDKLTQILWLV